MSHYDDFAASAINAELPSWFYLVWGAGKLIALPKPIPRDPVLAAAAALDPPARPISIGEVDLGAIMGEVIRQSAPSFQDYLAPQQVAVGVSGGISIVYYGLRLLLCELQPGFVVCSKHRGDLGNSPIFARFSRPPESLCELGIAIFISDDSASIRGNLENWGDMFFISARSRVSLCEFGIVI